MKKKIVLLMTLTIFALAGCSSSASTDTADSDEIQKLNDRITKLEQENSDLNAQLEAATNKDSDSDTADSDEIQKLNDRIAKLEQENSDLSTQLEAAANKDSNSDASTSKEDHKDIEEDTKKDQPETTSTTITVGDTITTDAMEITINMVELSYDVLPDDTSGFYTHYPADSGNVYIHLDFDVKNLTKQNLPCDEIAKVVADYNGGYTYSGFSTVEDSITGFTYSDLTSISPLETKGVHYLVECPQEVEESDNPLFVTIIPATNKDSYILTIR